MVQKIAGHILFLITILWATNLYAERKGFNERDIHTAFRTGLSVRLIKNSIFPDHLSLSADGKLMAFTLLTEDIQNNELFIMKSDGSDLTRIQVPNGFKGFPNIVGDFLYFNFTPYDIRKSKGVQKGRYRISIRESIARLQFQYAHFFPYTRFNQPDAFRPVRHEKGVGIELIRSDGSVLRSLYLKTKLAKNVRSILLDRDKRHFYVFAFDTSSGKYPPDIGIYQFENRIKAEGKLVIKDALNPTLGMTYPTKRALLYSHMSKGNIYEYDTRSEKTRVLIECINGYYCREPTFNPAKEVFYFIAQYKTEKFGFFEASWKAGRSD
jgi:hypothetical protein